MIPRLIPSDVREVIDRTDANMLTIIERLSVIADELAEQNTILNNLLRKGVR